MDQKILWTANHMLKTDDRNLPIVGLEEIVKARTFHESFPRYTKTPLTRPNHMATYLGVKEIYLRDESYRFSLNASKALDGSFFVARYIAKETGRDVSELPYLVLTSDQLREEFGQVTFFTTTDGSHGRGVVWATNRLGQEAVVHMPKGSTQTRLENIAKGDVQVDIQEMNYDNCVCLAAKGVGEALRSIMAQDMARGGYEGIPSWIMQGYGVMAVEAGEQLREYGYERPAHIFVQAGVSSLAGTMAGYFSNLYTDNPPAFVVVGAKAAACLYEGAIAGDGQIRIVDGDVETITTGLVCGKPSTIPWNILKNHMKVLIAASDWVVANGVHMLSTPTRSGAPVTSEKLGTAPFDALATIVSMDEYADLRKDIGLDENSKVLPFSTEGGTNPDRCKNIIWKGPDRQ